MLYIAIFCIATFALSEYLYSIYKESRYYREEVISISYVGDQFGSKEVNELKIKEL